MDCRTFHDRLEDFLDGKLSPDEHRAVEEHLRACADCRELDRLVNVDLNLPAVEPPPGLTEAILRRTSGSPCERSRQMLCDYVGASLGPVDAELVRLHVEGCEDCRKLAAVLLRLSEELPLLAELQPDARFVDDVLSMTLPLGTRLSRWLSGTWKSLAQRPRLAWEGAYVGTIVLLMIFGIPNSPLAGVPKKALDLAKVNPVTELSEPVANLETQVTSGVLTAWQATGGKVAATSREVASDVGQVSSATFENIKTDLGTLWNRITSDTETDEDTGSTKDEDTTQGDRS